MQVGEAPVLFSVWDHLFLGTTTVMVGRDGREPGPATPDVLCVNTTFLSGVVIGNENLASF